MRISVPGDSDVAKVLRGCLAQAGYLVTAVNPAYTVLVEDGSGPHIVIDGINCRFKDAVQDSIAELTDTRIEYHRAGGVQSDRAIHVVTAPGEDNADAVERGLLRAILIVTGHGARKTALNKLLFWRKA